MKPPYWRTKKVLFYIALAIGLALFWAYWPYILAVTLSIALFSGGKYFWYNPNKD